MLELFSQPEAWAALLALVTLEVVLGIDNLLFISILTNRLPQAQQATARKIGIGLALGLRIALLFTIVWLVGLTKPVFDLGLTGPLDPNGHPTFETAFSWRDLIMIAGGMFLVFKATTEIQHHVDVKHDPELGGRMATATFGAVVAQIIAVDFVFSLDSILTAVGMTDQLPIMVIAVLIAVTVMFLAVEPMAKFLEHNQSVIMLALAFLLMIGMVLIADGFGVHVPKGYIYAAMAFAVFTEALNMVRRNRLKAARAREHTKAPA